MTQRERNGMGTFGIKMPRTRGFVRRDGSLSPERLAVKMSVSVLW